MLSYEQIKEIIQSIDDSSIRVFELGYEDMTLKLSKNNENFNNVKNDNREMKGSLDEIKSSNFNNTDNNIKKIKDKEVVESSKDEELKIIKSPLVGTYYSSSTPGGMPFVEVGSKVKKGDVLCIVEAMKIMNEITSDFDGEIAEILRKDDDIVEFGMELFKIK